VILCSIRKKKGSFWTGEIANVGGDDGKGKREGGDKKGKRLFDGCKAGKPGEEG
jgi:hypothetical protein